MQFTFPIVVPSLRLLRTVIKKTMRRMQIFKVLSHFIDVKLYIHRIDKSLIHGINKDTYCITNIVETCSEYK